LGEAGGAAAQGVQGTQGVSFGRGALACQGRALGAEQRGGAARALGVAWGRQAATCTDMGVAKWTICLSHNASDLCEQVTQGQQR